MVSFVVSFTFSVLFVTGKNLPGHDYRNPNFEDYQVSTPIKARVGIVNISRNVEILELSTLKENQNCGRFGYCWR